MKTTELGYAEKTGILIATLQILEIRLVASVEYPLENLFDNMDDLNGFLKEQIDFIKKQLKKVGEE